MVRSRVLGVDACPAGWVGVLLDAARTAPTVLVGDDIAALHLRASRDGPLDVVGIDIPIGLPDRSGRAADRLARAEIGPRRSSVFLTPVRAALASADHATATRVNQELAGVGISVQAYGLRVKLLQVDRWVRSAPVPVIEVHPEVSFRRLAGEPLQSSKRTWAGAVHRHALLAGAGIELRGDLGLAGAGVAVDDVLDAAVVAWTARRYARGGARPLPDPPEVFSDGIAAAIWS